MALPGRALGPADAEGLWQGRMIFARAQQELDLMVELARTPAGEWAGTIDIPTQGLRFHPLQGVRVAEGATGVEVELQLHRIAAHGLRADYRLQGTLSDDGASMESGRIVLLDRPVEAAPSAAGSEAPCEGGAGPDDLAYVIYTSGSTGRPKGVMIEHRGAVNVIRENARLLRVGDRSKVLQLASLSFDASVLEIFTAISNGAELVLTGRKTRLSGEDLGEELGRRGITTLAIPPSALDKVPEGIELPRLTSIVVGGETCSGATAEHLEPLLAPGPSSGRGR